MKAIFKKEFRGYFQGIIGWLFLALFLAFAGIYIYVDNILNGYPYFEVVLQPLSMVLAFMIPMVTMRFMAEEKKQKTDQLLLTSGVPAEKIIAGKLLASFALLGIAMAVLCPVPLGLALFGKINFITAYGAIFAFFLMGCAYLTIGAFVSCTTEHQILAAILSYALIFFTLLSEGIGSLFETDSTTAFVTFFILILAGVFGIHMLLRNKWITGVAALVAEGGLILVKIIKPALLEGKVAELFGAFALTGKMNNFILGVFDLGGAVYYLSIIVLFYFLSVQVVKNSGRN
ncbi:MAG: ABC transporter permease [Lachnospiraceae bacterium]|nr:ABC transporter permease [Lachnospiraceae bacterium]